MPLFKKIDGNSIRVLVWKIAEPEQDLLGILGGGTFQLPSNAQRRLERLSVFCLLKYAGLTFPYTYDAVGKPAVAENCKISISHSYDFAALAISRNNAVGVDIERVDRNFLRVARKYLTPTELLMDLSQEELALIWSSKEAVFKMPWSRSLEISQDIEVEIKPSTMADGFVGVRVSDSGKEVALRLNFEVFDGYVLVWNDAD